MRPQPLPAASPPLLPEAGQTARTVRRADTCTRRLIMDAVHGEQQHFVRRDELEAAWRVFDPLLSAIDTSDPPWVRALSPLPGHTYSPYLGTSRGQPNPSLTSPPKP